MAYIPRWRLMCGPESENCQFVLTHTGGATSSLRAECTVHVNRFLITAPRKGYLKVETIDRNETPPPAIPAASRA